MATLNLKRALSTVMMFSPLLLCSCRNSASIQQLTLASKTSTKDIASPILYPYYLRTMSCIYKWETKRDRDLKFDQNRREFILILVSARDHLESVANYFPAFAPRIVVVMIPEFIELSRWGVEFYPIHVSQLLQCLLSKVRRCWHWRNKSRSFQTL